MNSSAEQYFNTATDCCRRNDMSSYLVRAMKSLIYWYEEQGRAAQAEVAWTEGHELMQHLSLPPIRLLSSLIPECEHA